MLINRRRKIIKIIWIFVGIMAIIGMVGVTLLPLFQAF